MESASANATHTVFVSHAHADNAQCDRYVAALRARGLDIWYDRSNLQSGVMLSAEIERELQARTVFIVFLSPAAVASYWVNLEIGAYRDVAARDPSRVVLPVRIAPCEVPLLLRGLKWIDATASEFDAVIEDIVRALAATPEERQVPVTPQSDRPVILCPRCGQLDHVRKVSVLGDDRRLVAPPDPVTVASKYNPVLVWTPNPRTVLPPVLLIIPVMLLVAVSSIFLTQPGSDVVGQADLGRVVIVIGFDIAAFLGWIITVGFTVWKLRAHKREAEKRRQQEIQRVRAQAQEQMCAWEQRMDIWRRLYYCGRDDIVFLPGDATAIAPAERMAQLLPQLPQ